MFVGRSVADRSVSSLLIVVLESLIENTAQSRQGWASEIRGSTRVFARPQSDSIQGLFSPSSKELTRGPSFNKVAGTHRWLVYTVPLPGPQAETAAHLLRGVEERRTIGPSLHPGTQHSIARRG